ncbi:SIMPL domain-containing protein [Ramlibacter sp. AW1]|uniref:SIMPL domain-containing protein n=1 Tax=Ramlibacter aurantiacus TaxID=2801330 RepID=A0A937D4I1_9BURK|nr:SIMPL domain-containing protein [Ramlibacter aurantiacus]MBL0420352.1 SIMPL domain-containing protein [Ramlibacter aurantiacus]
MKPDLRVAALILPWLLQSFVAVAQTPPATPLVPENVLNFSTSASVDVPQDKLSLRLSTTREAPVAQAVQEQLKAAVDQALGQLRPQAQEQLMEVRTGGLNVQPRFGRDGRIQSWTGTAEILLEGQDIARITRAAGRIESMTVAGVEFGLSRERLREAEARAQHEAIQRFRAKATELARAFGFGGYVLREASVDSNEQGPPPRPRMLAMEARAATADSPVPVEAGRTTVRVNVSGSIQMNAPVGAR